MPHATKPPIIRVDVKKCQRCASDHDQMMFRPLDNAADEFNWWGTCVNTGQPVLLTIKNDASGKAEG